MKVTTIRTVAVILIAGGNGLPCFAGQSGSSPPEVRDDLERMLEDFDTKEAESDAEQLVRFLQDLAADPVNINLAGMEELLTVPGVSLRKGKAILDYRRQVRPFESVEELIEVTGIGPATLDRMRPYVTVGSGRELRRTLYTDYRYWTDKGQFEAISRIRQTLQPREGYKREGTGGYLGSPVGYYQRLRYKSRHLSANLTQEKDPGEPVQKPLGFDYTSWHLAVKNAGKLEHFVAGDFSLAFGQGLVLWNGGSFGKGREVIGTVAKNDRGIRPYISARETGHFRGVAATYGGLLQATGFYSKRRRGARVVGTDTTRYPGGSGLHRTTTEMERKGTVGEELYGGRIRTELPFGFVGMTGYRTKFSSFIAPGDAIYNRYDFTGRTGSALGLDFRLLAGSTQLFGEGARTGNGGYGWIGGVESAIDLHTDLVLAYRKYGPDFQSIYGSGFGEQSGEPQNEEGIYLGFRHQLNSAMAVSAYFDRYRFPTARFGTAWPAKGYEWLALLDLAFTPALRCYLQARSEQEEDDYETADPFGRTVRKLGTTIRSSLRGHLEYRANRAVRIRTRGEVVRSRRAGEAEEFGYLIYQDLRLTFGSRWTVDTRVTIFDTESYDSRVYQFENDLLYAFSNSALFNRGERLYLLVNYEPTEHLEIWAKFGVTVYEDLPYISSGLNRIEGNRKSDIGIQVRLRL